MLTRIKKNITLLVHHQGFRRYFSNTSWIFCEQILRMFAGIFIGVWVARYLGPNQFGLFSYSLAFVAMFSNIAKLGLDGIVVRDLVQEPEKKNSYLGTAFWLKVCGGILTLGIISCTTLLTSNDEATNFYILIIASGIIFQSFEVIDFYFRSKVLSKFVSVCKLIQLSLSSILKLYFVLTEADLLWFVMISLIDQITLSLTLYVAYRYQKNDSFYRHFDFLIAKKFLKDGWPLIVSSFIVMIHMRSDQVMIKEMLGEREVGIYSAATKLSEVWNFIPVIITQSFFSAIVKAKQIGLELYTARLQQLSALMVWVGVVIALPLTLMSGWLTNILYGKAYEGAGYVLAVHVWGLIFVSHVSMRTSALLVEKKQAHVMFLAGVTLIAHLILTFILINMFGIVGAAMASLISWFLCACIFPIFFADTKPFIFIFLKSFLIRKSLWKSLYQK